jgi:hypothetical protein
MALYSTGQVPSQDFGLSNDFLMGQPQDVADHPANDLPIMKPKVKKRMKSNG